MVCAISAVVTQPDVAAEILKFQRKYRLMTQLEQAKKNVITPEMRSVAEREPLSAEEIRDDIAAGRTVILKSDLHDCAPVGIGRGLKIKINANIGTSRFNNDPAMELEKLAASVRYGADTVMDLSTGGDIRAMRRTIVTESKIPVGTVPVYEAIVRCPDVAGLSGGRFSRLDPDAYRGRGGLHHRALRRDPEVRAPARVAHHGRGVPRRELPHQVDAPP